MSFSAVLAAFVGMIGMSLFGALKQRETEQQQAQKTAADRDREAYVRQLVLIDDGRTTVDSIMPHLAKLGGTIDDAEADLQRIRKRRERGRLAADVPRLEKAAEAVCQRQREADAVLEAAQRRHEEERRACAAESSAVNTPLEVGRRAYFEIVTESSAGLRDRQQQVSAEIGQCRERQTGLQGAIHEARVRIDQLKATNDPAAARHIEGCQRRIGEAESEITLIVGRLPGCKSNLPRLRPNWPPSRPTRSVARFKVSCPARQRPPRLWESSGKF